MDSRSVCKGRCQRCGARACCHPRGHYGPCECRYHASGFMNRVVGYDSTALRNWLTGEG